MTDKFNDQPAPDASPERLQKDSTTRVVRPVVYVATALGAVLGVYANPQDWVQSVLLYGFLGFTIGILLGSLLAWIKRINS